ncbi:MAG: hypothetical protein ACK559_35535, partial [bacterium]
VETARGLQVRGSDRVVVESLDTHRALRSRGGFAPDHKRTGATRRPSCVPQAVSRRAALAGHGRTWARSIRGTPTQ